MALNNRKQASLNFSWYKRLNGVRGLLSLAIALFFTVDIPVLGSQQPFVFAYLGNEQVDTLDYLDAHDSQRLAIEAQIMEGLLVFDIANHDTPVANLAAEAHSIPPSTYVFRLRRNVFFHPHRHGLGGVLTHEVVEASDVRFSLLRGKHSETPLAYLLEPMESIEVIGPDLLKINLNRSDPQFLYGLATSIGHVTCEAYYKGLGFTEAERSEMFQKHPIGTGPYRLQTSLAPERPQIVLERFEKYRDQDFVKDPQAVQQVRFSYRETAIEIADLLLAEEVHMTSLQMTDFGDGLGLRSEIGTITQLGTPFLSILAFNLDRPHLRDPELRRLLNGAVEPERILKICPSHLSDLGPGIQNFLDLKKAGTDKDQPETWTSLRTQQILAPLKRRRPLELLMGNGEDPTRKDIVEEVVRALKEKLGLEVEIKVSSRVLDDILGRDRDFDLVYIEWTPDTPLQQEDLSILYPLFSSKSHYNFARYENMELDRYFYDILRLGNPRGLEETYRRAQVLLGEDAPFVWLPSVRHRAVYLLANYSAMYQEQGDLPSEITSSLMLYTPFLAGVRKGL